MRTNPKKGFINRCRSAMGRIYLIDALVRSRTFPSVSRLVDELEVSRRTVERELEYLRDQMNAPLRYDRTRGGYCYTADFRLPPFSLSEGEVIALFIGSKILSQYRGTPYEKLIKGAFDKICLALPETVSLDFSLIDQTMSFAVERPRGDEQHLLRMQELLNRALREHRTVELEYYTASRDADTSRRVDPYHLRHHRGAWYVVGYCHFRAEVRMFALDRITNLQVTKERFTPDPNFDIQTYVEDSLALERGGELEEVHIRFDRFQARYIRERQWHSSQEITEHPDGTMTLMLRVRGLGEVKRWIMSFGHHAEVLAPAWLREEVAAEVEMMAKKYGMD
ncbi:MAG: WYL domain-containing protein [Bacillota bacterium]